MIQMKMARGCLAAVLLSLLGAASADCEERPLRVAMSGDYMPLHGMPATGYEADVARALGEALGRPVRFLPKDQLKGGALAAVASGAADVALNAVTPTPERAEKVDFTAPIAALDYLVVTGKDSTAESFAAACPRTIAVAEGPAASALRAANPVQKVTVVKSTAAAVDLFKKGKVDCALGEDVGLFMAVNDTELTVIDEPIGISPIAMAVPKGHGTAYDAHLIKIGEQLKALRKKWQLQEPRAGLKYATITLPREAKPATFATRYVAVRSTAARTTAKAVGQVLFKLEPGDIVNSPQYAHLAGEWIETTKDGTRAWASAADLVDLDGPFISTVRQEAELDPDQPCVDTPCGCIVYRPVPVNNVGLSDAGEELLTEAFAQAASQNAHVYSRRKLARAVLRTLLDKDMHEIVAVHTRDRERFNKCMENCLDKAEIESDACCDCPEPEQYNGIAEAFGAIESLAQVFIADQDPEVAHRGVTAFCGFLKAHQYPDILYKKEIDSFNAFNSCGIHPE